MVYRVLFIDEDKKEYKRIFYVWDDVLQIIDKPSNWVKKFVKIIIEIDSHLDDFN